MAGHIYNELIITFTDNNETGVIYEADITAENIVEESMKLVQSINDENYLKFGGCIYLTRPTAAFRKVLWVGG